jgi:hypothetical protein
MSIVIFIGKIGKHGRRSDIILLSRQDYKSAQTEGIYHERRESPASSNYKDVKAIFLSADTNRQRMSFH